ncbi:MAG TPA: NlpC/P60 family protein [Pseudonocardiaceae bacterium]
MRGALAAGVVLAAVLAPAGPAAAAPASPSPSPAPAQASDPLAQYQQLSGQAEVLNEQYLSAQNDYNAKLAQEKQAEAAVASAKQAEAQAEGVIDQFRSQADRVAAASFESGNMNSVSALFTGESAQDYLERESLLLDVATDSSTVLDTLQAAYNKAANAVTTAQKEQKVLQDAANAANALLTQKQQALQALNKQLQQVELAAAKLSPTDKAEITSIGVAGNWVAPGVRGEAMMYALTRRGDWYVWGAAGPSTFDCSGLIVWSYAQLGISLPHSAAALQRMGSAVSRSNLAPGDLVFFGSPAHHVGIYVGKDSSGNDLMVNAPTSGEVVRVQTLNSDYSNARRLNY